MFSVHFDAKQCRDCFQQPHACDPPWYCVLFSFICRLLLELDPYSGNAPDGMFPLLYRQVTWERAPKFVVSFRHLVRWGSFPGCWRLVDVVPVPKGSAS